MRFFEREFDGRQHMLRPDFDLQHLRDILPGSISEHRHDYYELLFILASNNLKYQVGEQVYKVMPNNIVLVNSMVNHHPIINQHSIYDRLLLWLTPEFVRSISPPDFPLWVCFEDPLNRIQNVLYMRSKVLMPLKHAFLRLEQHYFSDLYGHAHLARVYLTEILMMLNRTYLGVVEDAVEEENHTNKAIEAVVDYILENLSGDLSLAHLAERFYINKYHLSREFKKYVGYTIHHYVQIQRLKAVEDLLLNTDRSLTELCYRCGFGDYSSLFRMFKQRYGMTPSEYRACHRD